MNSVGYKCAYLHIHMCINLYMCVTVIKKSRNWGKQENVGRTGGKRRKCRNNVSTILMYKI